MANFLDDIVEQSTEEDPALPQKVDAD